MASEVASGSSAPESKTAAQLLMEQHEDGDHHATVEDAVDEEDVIHPPPSAHSTDGAAPTLSEKAAGKQKADDSAPKKPAGLNTASEELFPALGPVKPRTQAVAPTWGKKPASVTANGANGAANGTSNATSRASTPASGAPTPMSLPLGRGPGQPNMSLPGKHKEMISFHPSQLTPRQQLKKPLGEIIREINKKSKAKLEVKQGQGGVIVFESTGPVDAVRQTLKDIATEVGSKQTVKVPVPSSVRSFIIGRQGSKIQEIQKRSGAKVQVPRPEAGEDEDTMIDVVIEGNALTAEMARREIESIVNERTSTVNLRLKDIPAEYYPFLAGPHNANINNIEQGRDVRVQIPHYTTWNTQAPPQAPRNQPIPFVPQPQLPIQISGERVAAQEVQAMIERRVQELRRQLAIEQRSVERGRHQFIVGDRGGSLHDFIKETGCSIIVPPNTDDSEMIYIVGPPDKIDNGVNKLEDIAGSMHVAMVDCAREHKGAQAQTHAHNLTRYLKQRQALQELERMHEASIVVPHGRNGPTAWEIYARNGKNTMKARGDIQSVFASHPPSRFSTVDVDPFYHHFLQQRNAQHIRDDTGVHVVFPSESDDEESPELILVYEGTTPSADYTIPRGAPPAAEVQAYKQALQQAQQFIQSITSAQHNIVLNNVDAPPKFHEKIRRYVDREQSSLPRDVIPVQLLVGDRRPQQAPKPSSPGVAIRGPAEAVEDLRAKILAFIEQEEKDELERGFTMSFDFPQKFANFLIGKRGDNIRKLREEYDVDIQVNDGKVELKGPQAKANACKAHILSLAKRLEDEATHTLKIKSQYHRDLIGAKGSQVNRLQDRYNVRINFPRTSNHANDDDAATEGGNSQKNFRQQAPDEVIIRGPRKGADEAREELLNLLQWTVDNSHTDAVSVAQSQVPSLIGSGGREMENLRLTTGCQIDVPGAREGADPSGRAEIRLKGTKKQVEEAKKLIQERAKVFDDTVVKNIDVDRKHHRTLIGSNGSNIRQIVTAAGGPDNARDLARLVKFPRADSDGSTIKVEGPKALVEKIVASIEAQVASLDGQITETIDVSPDKHRILIGRGGEARRNLESQFNIQLDIPKQGTTGAARNQVKITGEPAQVEKAKEHILDLVKGQEGETIQVPAHLHHAISDNGQFFRRLRNEHKITVDHAGQQLPPRPTQPEGGKARKGANGTSLPLITDDTDAGAEETYSWELVDNTPASGDSSSTIPWVLRGPADNLPKARQAVEAAIEANSKPSSTGYLILPDPRSYRLVVGSGGSTINSIRKKTGTRVQVPRDQKDEAIEIVGSKEGVEEAKKMILEIVGRGGGARK
ncbi:RNA binding effector protein-like protein Scp160 [Clohesyomyces aquaticus]|uniref:RNA binding effector protein-like protein Scp160 n=1 Tax=Clohesyomyces aquaticus TaxID=1231657 RepID=A0A1Y1YXB8_9PLEO|nr:RNA binding effector protein-like protein Scp160 [Clohesyomyces aquaticus]